VSRFSSLSAGLRRRPRTRRLRRQAKPPVSHVRMDTDGTGFMWCEAVGFAGKSQVEATRSKRLEGLSLSTVFLRALGLLLSERRATGSATPSHASHSLPKYVVKTSSGSSHYIGDTSQL
jgi:hypothetical protein